jgi:hypothetical protein
MIRMAQCAGIVAILLSVMPSIASAETVDEKFKRIEKDPTFKIIVNDNAEDECRNCNDVITIQTKGDGKIPLKCGEHVYFENPNSNEKWTWWCGGSEQKARIKGSTYIRATRAPTGKVTWEWVQIGLK